MTDEFLQSYGDAWNRHDLTSIMGAMTEDCIFIDSSGSKHEGQKAVREVFSGIFESIQDAQWEKPSHVVSGNRGFSEWVFTGIDEDGDRLEEPGCDIFTFRDGKIAVKNTYLK